MPRDDIVAKYPFNLGGHSSARLRKINLSSIFSEEKKRLYPVMFRNEVLEGRGRQMLVGVQFAY